MTIPSSGPLSFADLADEMRVPPGAPVSMNNLVLRQVDDSLYNDRDQSLISMGSLYDGERPYNMTGEGSHTVSEGTLNGAGNITVTYPSSTAVDSLSLFVVRVIGDSQIPGNVVSQSGGHLPAYMNHTNDDNTWTGVYVRRNAGYEANSSYNMALQGYSYKVVSFYYNPRNGGYVNVGVSVMYQGGSCGLWQDERYGFTAWGCASVDPSDTFTATNVQGGGDTDWVNNLLDSQYMDEGITGSYLGFNSIQDRAPLSANLNTPSGKQFINWYVEAVWPDNEGGGTQPVLYHPTNPTVINVTAPGGNSGVVGDIDKGFDGDPTTAWANVVGSSWPNQSYGASSYINFANAVQGDVLTLSIAFGGYSGLNDPTGRAFVGITFASGIRWFEFVNGQNEAFVWDGTVYTFQNDGTWGTGGITGFGLSASGNYGSPWQTGIRIFTVFIDGRELILKDPITTLDVVGSAASDSDGVQWAGVYTNVDGQPSYNAADLVLTNMSYSESDQYNSADRANARGFIIPMTGSTGRTAGAGEVDTETEWLATQGDPPNSGRVSKLGTIGSKYNENTWAKQMRWKVDYSPPVNGQAMSNDRTIQVVAQWLQLRGDYGSYSCWSAPAQATGSFAQNIQPRPCNSSTLTTTANAGWSDVEWSYSTSAAHVHVITASRMEGISTSGSLENLNGWSKNTDIFDKHSAIWWRVFPVGTSIATIEAECATAKLYFLSQYDELPTLNETTEWWIQLF